jgi:hypothetical protein
MTRKRPDIPVAVWNDDDSNRVVSADELRVQREEHEARIASLAPLVEGRKLKPIEILQHLAVAKRAHEGSHPDDPEARIPAALIDAVAIAIAGARKWSDVQAKLDVSNDDRHTERDRRRKRARAEADRLRAENPGISDSAIGRRLASATTTARTIRSYIKKD